MSIIEEIPVYDPVFAHYGLNVCSNAYINSLRERNLRKEGDIHDWIPQVGFQEKVLQNTADVLIIGGRRGSGKTAAMLMAPARYLDRSTFTCHGFRKEEDDIIRGLWNSSMPIYSDLASATRTSLTWRFNTGATVQFEHLANENNIDRRFRGVEMPFIIIDELPQISFQTFFTLLASNRNTRGFKNQFIASCNPVGPSHWVHRFLEWYIDPETKTIIPQRDACTRYFFKWGSEISEIAWGDSKEEVYEKAKGEINALHTEEMTVKGIDKFRLINSLCFIEGAYAENEIFMKRDPAYLGNLAQQGGQQSVKDISGVWADEDDSVGLVSQDDLTRVFSAEPQRGVQPMITGVLDVALGRDGCTMGCFHDNHLVAVERHVGVGSVSLIPLVRGFIERNHIPLRQFLFDANGLGQYLIEPLMADKGGAVAYRGSSPSSDKYIWANQRAECADKLAQRIRDGRLSIEPGLADMRMGKRTLREHLERQRAVFKRKSTSTGVFMLISKNDMRGMLAGDSPDELDMLIMHEYFNKTKGSKSGIKGLGLLNRR